jgi:small subunit ribosomal protein S18
MAYIKKKPSGQAKSRGQSAGQGRPGGKFRKQRPMRRKVCRFCADKLEIDYKNTVLLRTFVTENGKILPGRATGTCAGHQRELDTAIKRARMLAMLPFAVK